jgi:hypothetical protein
MLKDFEAIPVDAVLFGRPNDPLNHPVLLRTVRRDKLLFKGIASNQLSECEAVKNEAIQKWLQAARTLALGATGKSHKIHLRP